MIYETNNDIRIGEESPKHHTSRKHKFHTFFSFQFKCQSQYFIHAQIVYESGKKKERQQRCLTLFRSILNKNDDFASLCYVYFMEHNTLQCWCFELGVDPLIFGKMIIWGLDMNRQNMMIDFSSVWKVSTHTPHIWRCVYKIKRSQIRAGTIIIGNQINKMLSWVIKKTFISLYNDVFLFFILCFYIKRLQFISQIKLNHHVNKWMGVHCFALDKWRLLSWFCLSIKLYLQIL